MTDTNAAVLDWKPSPRWYDSCHSDPVLVSGPCRGGVRHVWALVSDHLACGRCGWVACCGRTACTVTAWKLSGDDCPATGGRHRWGLAGVHWQCVCSRVACCTPRQRKRRPGNDARKRLREIMPADRCFYCGVGFGDEEFGRNTQQTLDHYEARQNGGRNARNNYVWACYWCNHTKANRTVARVGTGQAISPTQTAGLHG